MFDNSPTFQRWVTSFKATSVPKGRLTPHTQLPSEAPGYSRMVPPGQDCALSPALARCGPRTGARTPALRNDRLRVNLFVPLRLLLFRATGKFMPGAYPPPYVISVFSCSKWKEREVTAMLKGKPILCLDHLPRNDNISVSEVGNEQLTNKKG